MQRDLTGGSIWKNILCFSLPYLLSYFLQTLYGMADLFLIGQYDGVSGTTAVSVGSQVMHMLTVMIVGLAMGSTVSIGQAVGGKREKDASRLIGNSAGLFSVLSILLTVVLLLLVRPIVVRCMSTPEEAVEGTVQYLTLCFLGIPFITAYNVISSVYRGMGDSRSPMLFVAIACGVNILLDIFFMGSLGLGPAGAALGTVLSQGVSVAVALTVILRKKSGLRLSREDFRPRRPELSQILRIGLPVSFQDGLIQVAFIVITIIANRRGLTDAAAVGVVEKIIGFLFLVPSTLLSTVSALGALNIGAGKPERAVRTMQCASWIGIGFGLICGILIQFLSEEVVGIFTTDASVRVAGGQYLRSYVWDCLFAGIHFSFSGYFCAVGSSGLSFLHNILSISLVRVPGAYLTSRLFPDSLFPMGLVSPAGSLLSVLVCLIAFRLLKKKSRSGSVPTHPQEGKDNAPA